MKAPLMYPEFPDIFWSFRYALKFIHRKLSSPPLGLLNQVKPKGMHFNDKEVSHGRC